MSEDKTNEAVYFNCPNPSCRFSGEVKPKEYILGELMYAVSKACLAILTGALGFVVCYYLSKEFGHMRVIGYTVLGGMMGGFAGTLWYIISKKRSPKKCFCPQCGKRLR